MDIPDKCRHRCVVNVCRKNAYKCLQPNLTIKSSIAFMLLENAFTKEYYTELKEYIFYKFAGN